LILTLREADLRSLRSLRNRMLWEIFEPEGGETVGVWSKLYNRGLHNS
jgi:hypothetical protein